MESLTAANASSIKGSCSKSDDLCSSGNSTLTLITHPSADTDDPCCVNYIGPKKAQLSFVDPTSDSDKGVVSMYALAIAD